MRIVIIGAGGRLGAALVSEFGKYHVVSFNHTHLDSANRAVSKVKIFN